MSTRPSGPQCTQTTEHENFLKKILGYLCCCKTLKSTPIRNDLCKWFLVPQWLIWLFMQTSKSAWKRYQFPRKKPDSNKIQMLTKSISKTPIVTIGPAHFFHEIASVESKSDRKILFPTPHTPLPSLWCVPMSKPKKKCQRKHTKPWSTNSKMNSSEASPPQQAPMWANDRSCTHHMQSGTHSLTHLRGIPYLDTGRRNQQQPVLENKWVHNIVLGWASGDGQQLRPSVGHIHFEKWPSSETFLSSSALLVLLLAASYCSPRPPPPCDCPASIGDLTRASLVSSLSLSSSGTDGKRTCLFHPETDGWYFGFLNPKPIGYVLGNVY